MRISTLINTLDHHRTYLWRLLFVVVATFTLTLMISVMFLFLWFHVLSITTVTSASSSFDGVFYETAQLTDVCVCMNNVTSTHRSVKMTRFGQMNQPRLLFQLKPFKRESYSKTPDEGTLSLTARTGRFTLKGPMLNHMLSDSTMEHAL